MISTLKKLLGNAGAGQDESMGFAPGSRLYDVLNALAIANSDTLTAHAATPSVAVLNGIVVDEATKLRNLRLHVGTTGTANSTTARVLVNGVSKGTLTIANTEADGSKDSVDLDVTLAAGDVVTIDLSAVATGAADVTVSARMNPVTVEA